MVDYLFSNGLIDCLHQLRSRYIATVVCTDNPLATAGQSNA
jgi:hypothetical protein